MLNLTIRSDGSNWQTSTKCNDSGERLLSTKGLEDHLDVYKRNINVHKESLEDRKERYYSHFKIPDQSASKLIETTSQMISNGDFYRPISLTSSRDCPHKLVTYIGVEDVSFALISCVKDGSIKNQTKFVKLSGNIEMNRLTAKEFFGLIARETHEFFHESGILSFLLTQNCKASVVLCVDHRLGNSKCPYIEMLKGFDMSFALDPLDPITGLDLIDVMNIQYKQHDTPAEVGLVLNSASAALA